MFEDKQKLVSPKGTVKFMALNRPAPANQYNDKALYSVRLEFDGADAEAAAFRNAIHEINSAMVVTSGKNVSKEGNFAINFKSTFQPQVLGAGGSKLEGNDVPRINTSLGDTATASVEVQVSTKGIKPTVYLKGVHISELNITEREGGEGENYQSDLEKSIQSNHIT